MSDVFAQLAELQVRRKFALKSKIRGANAAGALVRRFLGWRPDLPEKEAAAVIKKAAAVVASAKKDGRIEDGPLAVLLPDILAALQAAEPFERQADALVKEMEKLAKTLPAYPFAKSVAGFGDLGFAVIVAEAGDLTRYETVEKLWKRLGLAPVYGKACSTWRRFGGLSKDDWMDQGPMGPKYSPQRLAQVYGVVTVSLFKSQSVSHGKYRGVYDKRRERTAETHADWTKAHSHNDAMRVMVKAMIEDLWKEWRRAKVLAPEMASNGVPVSTPPMPRKAKVVLTRTEAKAAVPPAAPLSRKGGRVAKQATPKTARISLPPAKTSTRKPRRTAA